MPQTVQTIRKDMIVAPIKSLTPAQLCRRCDPAQFSFETTKDLDDLDSFIGQDRASEAVRFGINMARKGYNIFALGPTGSGKYTLVRKYAEARAAEQPPPSDWCYVNNFEQPYIPHMLRLSPGKGKQLRQDMSRFVEDLQGSLSSAFVSEEYLARHQSLEEDFQERQQARLTALQEQAKERDLAMLRTESGLVFAPVKDDNVIEPAEFEKLEDEEKERIKAEVAVMEEQLQNVLYQVPRWERELREQVRELNQGVTDFVVDDLMAELREKYAELEEVLRYLDDVKEDVGQNLGDFLADERTSDEDGAIPPGLRTNPMRRYEVNLLVDSSSSTGAPVIYDNNPSYLNLIGRVEQMAQMGALVTDFTLIKPGLLHRANGGTLILDAIKVLTAPHAWEGLKRALQFGEIRIESPTQMLSMTSTISLEPEPIPLDIKVILLGEQRIYYMLSETDPEFSELFKVAADFDDVLERDEKSQLLYAQLIATVARKEGLRPFDRTAVARVIEYSARLISDSERLSARMQSVVDLLEEADHWADQTAVDVVTADQIQQAIDAKVFRSDRVSDRIQEQTLRETVLIDTEGEVVGQINGLAVMQLGGFAFGKPSRITAAVRIGKGEVVDIEREVDMGGPSHTKGVLILTSYLQTRYAAEKPLSLGASLVFEQSYSGVDGDSASSTELYALLSAIAQLPIRQSLAVTGSVNQWGQVQAIGGVNEKIEGFFDLCTARGLTGEQGVLIPAVNVKNLMLKPAVVAAVEAGKFHIYPVATIDEGIEILTGVAAGEADENGEYPPDTVNRLVADRLQAFWDLRRQYDRPDRGSNGRDSSSSEVENV
jgi:lon-related putative ATP-dependent protease